MVVRVFGGGCFGICWLVGWFGFICLVLFVVFLLLLFGAVLFWFCLFYGGGFVCLGFWVFVALLFFFFVVLHLLKYRAVF